MRRLWLLFCLFFCLFVRRGGHGTDMRSGTEYDSELEDFEVIERQLEQHSRKSESAPAEERVSLEDELKSLARENKEKSDDSERKENVYLHDFVDMDDYQERRRRDLSIFDLLLEPSRAPRSRCPRLPSVSGGVKCEKTKSVLGEILSCRVSCRTGYREKHLYHAYEVCAKGTKYRWSYELKGLNSPQENCIKEAAKFAGHGQSADKQCTDKECIETGAYYTNKIDYSVNPCTNFYDYACGRWQKETEIPAHKMSVSTYSEIRDRVTHELARSLNGAIEKKDCEAVRKTKKIYKSCINTEVIEMRGGQPLLDVLQKELTWPILDTADCCGNLKLSDSIARLRRYNNDNLMKFAVLHHQKQYMIGIYKGHMALSSSVYTKSEFYDVKKKYYVLIMKTALLLGAKRWVALQDVLNIAKFEMAYMDLLNKWDDRDDDTQIYITIKQLSERFDNSKIDFRQLLRKMVLEHKMTDATKVKVKNPGWLADMLDLVARTPIRTLQNYIMWRFVKHRIENLSSDFRYELLVFRRSYGVSAAPPRWHTCSSQIMHGLPSSTGNLFISDYFSAEKKAAAKDLFENVRKGFLHNLKTEVTWMDAKTKEKAKEKAEAIRGYFGYNAQIYDNVTVLNEEMEQFKPNELDYFGNVLDILQYVASEHFQLLNIPYQTDKFVFTTRPSMVNAFYNPTQNAVLLPAGEMQHPFYWGDRYPRVFQFGAIGTILGHEITHGFDNDGRRYDLHGNRVNWWTTASLEEFKKRTNCIVQQFNDYYYTTAHEHLDGKQTLGENIADLGGIRNSHAGYQFWLKEQNLKSEKREPITGLTNDQLFFVGFANVRCAKAKPFGAEAQLTMDVHSPGRFRVIGSLTDFSKFSDAFNCPLGSPMNPRKKCILW